MGYLICAGISYIAAPVIVFTLMQKFFRSSNMPKWLHFIISAAFGPVFTSILLYYTLLLAPGKTTLFYIALVLSVFITITMLAINYIIETIVVIKNYVTQLYKEHIKLFIVLTLALTIFVTIWQYTVATTPITRHDTFEYATWGKIISNTKSIEYKPYNYDPDTGFFYVALHGLFFPLFQTWGNMVNTIFINNNDLYFRSISGWYWGLTVLTLFLWLKKYSIKMALLATTALVLTPAWVGSFIYYHLDTFRICFLTLTCIVFIRILNYPGYSSLTIFGAMSGVSANAHSSGALFSVIFMILYLVFSKDHFKYRLIHTSVIFIYFLLFGGLHYLLDTFFGTGWILNKL